MWSTKTFCPWATSASLSCVAVAPVEQCAIPFGGCQKPPLPDSEGQGSVAWWYTGIPIEMEETRLLLVHSLVAQSTFLALEEKVSKSSATGVVMWGVWVHAKKSQVESRGPLVIPKYPWGRGCWRKGGGGASRAYVPTRGHGGRGGFRCRCHNCLGGEDDTSNP